MGWIRTRKKMFAMAALPVFGIGFLRVLLALSVVFDHSGPILFFGFIDSTIAVQSFFIVSGFYMVMILTEKYKKYSAFILNRFLRIYPLYLSILIITVAVSFIAHYLLNNNLNLGFSLTNPINPAALVLLVFSNIFIFGQDILFFIGANSAGLYFVKDFQQGLAPQGLFVPQAWTLSLELMFYLIAPFIVYKKNKLILGLILLGIILRAALYFMVSKDLHYQWTYIFFPAELVFFLIGIISYRTYKVLRNIKIDRRILIFSAIIFFLYLVFYTYIPLISVIKKGLYFLMLILNIPLLFILCQKSKFDRYIGELSYPIYLSHLLILKVLELIVKIPKEFLGLVLALISILASVFLYHFVVKPFDSFRRKRLQTAADIKIAAQP